MKKKKEIAANEQEAAEKRRRFLWRYGFGTLVLFTLAAAMAWWKNLFAAKNAAAVFRILADSFTVPGAVYAGLGGLSFFASKGAYDSFAYIFNNFALHNLFPLKYPKKYISLYEYKQDKNEKGRTWWPHLLWLGCGALAFSLLCTILFFVFET